LKKRSILSYLREYKSSLRVRISVLVVQILCFFTAGLYVISFSVFRLPNVWGVYDSFLSVEYVFLYVVGLILFASSLSGYRKLWGLLSVVQK
jgi:hypothetical protein